MNAEILQELVRNQKLNWSDLDSLRKKVAFMIGSVLGAWGLVLFLGLMFITREIFSFLKSDFQANQDYETVLGMIAFLLFLYVLAGIIFNNRRKKLIYNYLLNGEYSNRYRNEVISKVIPAFMKNASYHPEEGISKSDFRKSGFPLFSNPTKYHSSGAIKGELGKSEFVFAEVLAEELIDNESTTQYSDIFRGVFFIVDFKKSTDWDTLIYPDAIKYFSHFLLGKLSEEKSFSEKNYRRVKLEDVEFEKHFEVYGTDQTESRYVLSTALMTRILDFKKKTKKNIQFSFKNSKVYFGIYASGKQGLFTPPLFGSVYNLKYLESYINDIKLMLSIIEELNLNSTLNLSQEKSAI